MNTLLRNSETYRTGLKAARRLLHLLRAVWRLLTDDVRDDLTLAELDAMNWAVSLLAFAACVIVFAVMLYLINQLPLCTP